MVSIMCCFKRLLALHAVQAQNRITIVPTPCCCAPGLYCPELCSWFTGAKFDYIGDELYPIVGFDSMIWFDENGEPIDDLKEEMEDIAAEEAAKREAEGLAEQVANSRPSSAPARYASSMTLSNP